MATQSHVNTIAQPSPLPLTKTFAGHQPARPKRMLISTRCMRGLSGKVILLRNNIPALIDAGWEVSLLTEKHDAGLLQEIGAGSIPVRGWSLNKAQKLKRFNQQHIQLANSGRFDLVVSHGETLQQDILHVHNCRHLEHEQINGEYLFSGVKPAADLQARQLTEQRFRLVVANSQLMKDDLVQRYAIPGERIEVVYPGYDAQRFRPQIECPQSHLLRNKLGIAQPQRLIGLITSGKLQQRGADLLIQAFAQLPAALREQAQLLIVANDDFAPYVDQARAAGVADRVHFLPPRADVETYYRALDIYVNPARIETFGMALLEAMACGTACVTTRDKVGAGELFRDEMLNSLMDKADAESIQKCLQTLLQSRDIHQRHAAHCAIAARSHHWGDNVKRHLDIYARIHAAKRPQKALLEYPA